MIDAVRSMWWATLIIGIVAVVFGLVAVFMPVAALKAIILLMALYALITGLFAAIAGVRAIRHDAAGWLELLWGVLGMALGALRAVRAEDRRQSSCSCSMESGRCCAGRSTIIAAIRLRHAMTGWVAMLLLGIAWLALGVLFLVAPGAAAVATTIVWGGLVALIGVITIVAAGFAHHAIKDLEQGEAAASELMQYWGLKALF